MHARILVRNIVQPCSEHNNKQTATNDFRPQNMDSFEICLKKKKKTPFLYQAINVDSQMVFVSNRTRFTDDSIWTRTGPMVVSTAATLLLGNRPQPTRSPVHPGTLPPRLPTCPATSLHLPCPVRAPSQLSSTTLRLPSTSLTSLHTFR